VQEALGAPLRVYLNSMVIRGAEPVIVDTGTIANRAQWLDDVFGLVAHTAPRVVGAALPLALAAGTCHRTTDPHPGRKPAGPQPSIQEVSCREQS
jgi:hypothetical protein